MTIEAFLAALGLKGLPTVVVGAVGSLVSVHFGEGGIGQRATTFAGGCAIAWWGGPQVAAYSETTKYEIGIVLLCGLFGMPAVGEAMKFIREGGWKNLVPSISRRGGGEGNNKGA
jgi:hypothetical protein